MRAGVFYDDRDVRPGDVADPRLGRDQVLVETGYAGICGTDPQFNVSPR